MNLAPAVETDKQAKDTKREAAPLVALLLLALIVLLPVGWRSRLQSSASFSEAAPLDSFSAPSLALSILNREALRLVMAYAQRRDTTRLPGRPQAPDSTSGSALSSSLGGGDVIRPIAKLHDQVQAFKIELDCRLMWVYADHGLGQQFLDRYLCLLAEAPDGPDVKLWMAQAVQYAPSSGRSEELVDALRHWARFHATPDRVKVLNDLLRAKGLISPGRDGLPPRP
jgi:hypothetical protein